MSDSVLARIDDMGARIDGAPASCRGLALAKLPFDALTDIARPPAGTPPPATADLERSVGELIQQSGVDGGDERRPK